MYCKEGTSGVCQQAGHLGTIVLDYLLYNNDYDDDDTNMVTGQMTSVFAKVLSYRAHGLRVV